MPTVKESFDAMPSRFRSDKATGTSAVIQYDVSGDGAAPGTRSSRTAPAR
jgi:hypothetical protein